MRTPILAIAGCLASCASVPAASQRPPPSSMDRSSKFDLYLGVRSLDEDDWAPVEDQGTIGIEFVHEAPGSAVGFELAAFASGNKEEDFPIGGGSTIDVHGRTSELSAGIRKTFSPDGGPVHPYLGAGVAAIRAEFEGASGGSAAEDDDGSGGIYLHGGVDFDIGPSFLLGVDLRFLGGTDITLFGADGSADYAQLALVLGVRF